MPDPRCVVDGGYGMSSTVEFSRPIRVDQIGKMGISNPIAADAVERAALMQRLAQAGVPLTVCPLSNLKLRVFPTLAQHNLKTMLDAGIVATVNSDDPAYFGGYVNENFTQTFAALGMNSGHAYQLARNSFNAAFLDATAKRDYIDRLDACFDRFAASGA